MFFVGYSEYISGYLRYLTFISSSTFNVHILHPHGYMKMANVCYNVSLIFSYKLQYFLIWLEVVIKYFVVKSLSYADDLLSDINCG